MNRRDFLKNSLIAFTAAAIPPHVMEKFLDAPVETTDATATAWNDKTSFYGIDVAVHGEDYSAIMTFIKEGDQVYIKNHRFVPRCGESGTITYTERFE